MAEFRDDGMVYAGFWRRLGALLVDAMIFLPLISLDLWLDRLSRTYFFTSLLPLFLFGLAYSIYFHVRWGQTLGKMATGIKVVSLGGSPISLRQAFLRDSVGLAFSLITTIIYASAVANISPEDYRHLSFRARSQRITELSRPWRWINWLSDVWSWSEVVVILFNKKRRALHDFVAGTVVVRVQKVNDPREAQAALS